MDNQSLGQLAQPATNNAESDGVLEQFSPNSPKESTPSVSGLTLGGKPDPLCSSCVHALDVPTSGQKFFMLNSYYVSHTQGASIFSCLENTWQRWYDGRQLWEQLKPGDSVHASRVTASSVLSFPHYSLLPLSAPWCHSIWLHRFRVTDRTLASWDMNEKMSHNSFCWLHMLMWIFFISWFLTQKAKAAFQLWQFWVSNSKGHGHTHPPREFLVP